MQRSCMIKAQNWTNFENKTFVDVYKFNEMCFEQMVGKIHVLALLNILKVESQGWQRWRKIVIINKMLWLISD